MIRIERGKVATKVNGQMKDVLYRGKNPKLPPLSKGLWSKFIPIAEKAVPLRFASEEKF